jgi:hypothetical protein
VLESVAETSDGRGFGLPAAPEELAYALRLVLPPTAPVEATDEVVVDVAALDAETRGSVRAVSGAVARAHGWASATENDERVRFRPALP